MRMYRNFNVLTNYYPLPKSCCHPSIFAKRLII